MRDEERAQLAVPPGDLVRASVDVVGDAKDAWGDLEERIRPYAEHVVARIAQSRRQEPSNG